ncbi:hypothetical protein [Desulfosporosinus sp. FKA]|uniref:hypothetical protein n=1 Tax=Desulfosporosinus sp. FKA TaxID=1969834 RepID=UPI000B4991C2|nr:hypothetical protein [Desulfosporosinus sp. FKA]
MDKDKRDGLQEGDDNMPALAPIKKRGLTTAKKEGLKKMMGKYSGKASLSTIRDLRKNETNQF